MNPTRLQMERTRAEYNAARRARAAQLATSRAGIPRRTHTRNLATKGRTR